MSTDELPQPTLFDGKVSSRVGNVHKHPIQIKLEAHNEMDKMYEKDCSLGGKYYADFKKGLYKMMKRAAVQYSLDPNASSPSLNVLLGKMNELDFEDMFDPDIPTRDVCGFDGHQVIEKLYFTDEYY